MIGIPNSSKSTELYELFKLNTTATQLNVSKLKLLQRMQENTYTNELIKECIRLKEFGGLIGEAIKILGVKCLNSINNLNTSIDEFLLNVKYRANEVKKVTRN